MIEIESLLEKYDGKCALTYDSNVDSRSNGSVELFYLDDHWRVWVGTENDGSEIYYGDSLDIALQTFHNRVLKLEQGE